MTFVKLINMYTKLGFIGVWILIFMSSSMLVGQVTEIEPFPTSTVAKNQTSHEVKIDRVVKNPVEEKILQIAESAYPEATAIEKDCPTSQNASRPRQIPSSPRWWCGSFDGILIPFAITRAAVAYYLAVTDDFRQGNFERSGKIKMTSSSLRYAASVVKHTSYTTNDKKVFSNVHEVTMTLVWSQFCGSLCAMSSNLKRTVIVSDDGKILIVVGDGRAWTVVS